MQKSGASADRPNYTTPLDPCLDDRRRSRVDADGPAPVTLAVQHRNRPTLQVDVLESQRQHLTAPHAGAVEHGDQRPVAEPQARRLGTLIEQREDLVGRQHLGGVRPAFVGRHTTAVVAGLGDVDPHHANVGDGRSQIQTLDWGPLAERDHIEAAVLTVIAAVGRPPDVGRSTAVSDVGLCPLVGDTSRVES